MISNFTKAHPGLAHQACATPIEKFDGFVFVNFDCINALYYNCSQNAMFTIRILFPTLTTKTFGICEGTSKQSPNPKNSTRLGSH